MKRNQRRREMANLAVVTFKDGRTVIMTKRQYDAFRWLPDGHTERPGVLENIGSITGAYLWHPAEGGVG